MVAQCWFSGISWKVSWSKNFAGPVKRINTLKSALLQLLRETTPSSEWQLLEMSDGTRWKSHLLGEIPQKQSLRLGFCSTYSLENILRRGEIKVVGKGKEEKLSKKALEHSPTLRKENWPFFIPCESVIGRVWVGQSHSLPCSKAPVWATAIP